MFVSDSEDNFFGFHHIIKGDHINLREGDLFYIDLLKKKHVDLFYHYLSASFLNMMIFL